jgi:radical SAM superfamily enzyme with C-terminal helix-hairpin-helix motif
MSFYLTRLGNKGTFLVGTAPVFLASMVGSLESSNTCQAEHCDICFQDKAILQFTNQNELSIVIEVATLYPSNREHH